MGNKNRTCHRKMKKIIILQSLVPSSGKSKSGELERWFELCFRLAYFDKEGRWFSSDMTPIKPMEAVPKTMLNEFILDPEKEYMIELYEVEPHSPGEKAND